MKIELKTLYLSCVIVATTVLSAAPLLGAVTVYDCIHLNNLYNTTFNEVGDEVTLAGTERMVREVTFGYNVVAYVATGSEQVVLRLYDLSAGEPGSVLYQSASIPLNTGVQYYTVSNIDTVVPDTLVWTVAVSGYTAGAGIYTGPIVADADPTIGSSTDYVWNKTAGGWVQYDLGDALANLEARIMADPVAIPAPGAILLGSIGAGLVGWLRRRRAL